MVTPHTMRSSMMHGGESHTEALGQMRPLVHPKNVMKIGNWNVRTLYQSGNIAQASREMKKRGIDIMGISETHWTGQEKVVLQRGDTIIHSGREDDNHRGGVGILMTRFASRSLMDWTPISERIITARFYSKHVKMTIVHVYAPTEDAEETVKDEFYERLQDVLNNKKEHDMLVITGDMNAKVGEDNRGYEGIMGRHGIGRMNDNGERLCEFCDMNELIITGTWFPHRDIHKATWVSPDGKTRNQIDHVLINKEFRNSVIDTRVYRSADIGSDHHLVCMKVKLRLRKQQSKEQGSIRTRYDTNKLKEKNVLEAFKITLQNRYQVLEEESPDGDEEDEIEKEFHIMEEAYMKTADEVLGRPRKKRKPWITEESWALVDQREG